MIDEDNWNSGKDDLHKTAEREGVFCTPSLKQLQ